MKTLNGTFGDRLLSYKHEWSNQEFMPNGRKKVLF